MLGMGAGLFCLKDRVTWSHGNAATAMEVTPCLVTLPQPQTPAVVSTDLWPQRDPLWVEIEVRPESIALIEVRLLLRKTTNARKSHILPIPV